MYSFMQKKRAVHVEEAGAAQPAMVNLDVVSHSRPFTSKSRGKLALGRTLSKYVWVAATFRGGGGTLQAKCRCGFITGVSMYVKWDLHISG